MGYPSVGILYKFIAPQIVSLTPADCFFKVPQILFLSPTDFTDLHRFYSVMYLQKYRENLGQYLRELFFVPQISQIYTEHSDDNGENLCKSVKSVGLKNNLWDKESAKPKNLCESVKSVGLKKNNP